MTPILNTRARLQRAIRNQVPLQSATETFRTFKWFTLIVVVLLPIYPSFSLIGSDVTAHGADYDESSIITAYSDDSLGDASIFSEDGLIALGKDTPVRVDTQSDDVAAEQVITTPALAEKKRAPQIVRYTVETGDTLAKI